MINRLITVLALAPLLMAQQCATTRTAPAPGPSSPAPARQSDIGVVVLHGKGATPRGAISGLVSRLGSAGFRVVAPEMPWSRSRGFSRDVNGALAEISDAAARLRASGAKRIVIAGHSLGAVTAMAYAARNRVAGIVILAPGHYVFAGGFQNRVHHDWRKAQQMVSAGQGGQTASFSDINMGRNGAVSTTADIYLSWYRPGGPIDMTVNMRAVARGTPVLWINGGDDPQTEATEQFGLYRQFPANPKNRKVTVPASHLGVPRAAASTVIDWLRSL